MGARGILPRWLTGAGLFLACISALATPVLLTIVFIAVVKVLVTDIGEKLAVRPGQREHD